MAINYSLLRKFYVPEFVFGERAINLTGKYVKRFHAQKILLVTDEGLAKAGWLKIIEHVLKSENLKYVVFDEVTPNPKDYTAMYGAEFLRKEKCDIIIALGGGSPMDCAKAIGIVATNNKPVIEFEGVDEIEIPGLPLICLPTTAGTSADISQFAIINEFEMKRKFTIVSKKVVPDVALIDPLTTSTMPADLTAATGMDALVHAIEAYVSNANSLVTDFHALQAIKLVINNLPGAFCEPGNMLYRNNMMLASLLAGFAFSNAGLGLVHSMAHSLGGLLDLPHGECNSLLLTSVIDINFNSADERYYDIAKIFKPKITAKDKKSVKSILLDEIKKLEKKVGITYSLENVGVKKSDIPALARNAYNDACLATNPKQVTIKEIEECFKHAF
ncbi:MAG: iron-containing alcohol dehydrogenase [Ignavibacteriales bacterium]|nr:MAG: iron-containing alcohol dehydrogenase [Ignavibacteriales bacterium]